MYKNEIRSLNLIMYNEIYSSHNQLKNLDSLNSKKRK